MNDLVQLKQAMADYLRASGEVDGADILIALPASAQNYPLRRPTVAIGLDSVEAAPAGLGRHLGETADGRLTGTGAKITLRFDLYAPAAEGGSGVQTLYERLCCALMIADNPFGGQKLCAGETVYNGGAQAFYLRARLTLSAALTHEQTCLPIQTFTLRRTQ